ncbi:MAG: DUF3825 domain-containing protein [Albidovulum sp.]|nr:DUF3825 domain-containing protein [Albidovulum sp.]
MEGQIKRFLPEQGYGFIEVTGQPDVFFIFKSIEDNSVRCEPGEKVEFEASENPKKPGRLMASNIRLVAGFKHEKLQLSGHPGSYLYQWGYIQLDDSDRNGKSYTERGVLHDLADIALVEDWKYGGTQHQRTPFPILKNYLIYTFYKQYCDKKVSDATHAGQSWAAFNTGLVDDRYEPIFALFGRNDRSSPPWKFFAFCRPNIDREGQELVSNFNPLPLAPKYFGNAEDVIFDPDTTIHPRYDHIVHDSIEKNRYPPTFLQKHVPLGIEWKDPTRLRKEERDEFLKDFRRKLKTDASTDLDIRNRINDAIDLAVKRARWNFKTAIPLYHPKANTISLLLPIALVDDNKADLALVVSRTAAGGYSGDTVYKLNWAYNHARLVCRPDSDWLTPTGDDDGDFEDVSLPGA